MFEFIDRNAKEPLKRSQEVYHHFNATIVAIVECNSSDFNEVII
jgi:hypothetical protein